jgi:Ca-activated chloride channel homolog
MIAELTSWQFAWAWLLLALPLPLLIARLLPPAQVGLDAALRIPFAAELHALHTQAMRTPRSRTLLLPLLAWTMLCVAAARPQQLGEVTQPPQTGRDLLLAVDLSGSMAEQDMNLGGVMVDRLTAVKAVLGDFLDRRIGDRVGLLLFGQRAYAMTPLTLDRESVRQQLDDSVVGLAGQETAIGDAIALAVKRLTEQPDLGGNDRDNKDQDGKDRDANQGQRVVILLTDGVNTAGSIMPDKAAELAHNTQVRVHTIGFGGDGGRTSIFGMPMQAQSQIDETTLREIAIRTGGRYFRARDTRELAGIYAELDRIEPAAREGEVQRPRIERYPLPLSLGLAFAALALGARTLRGRV